MPQNEAHERIAALETEMRRVIHTLFGNGQPGELKELREKFDKLKWWVMIAAFLAAAAGGSTGEFVTHLLKYSK